VRSRAWRLRYLAAVVALAAAFLALPAGAVPEGKIVVHGPSSSSHLRLTVGGGDIEITGQVMDNPRGCKIVEGHRRTLCPIAHAGGIEIVMGPEDDKVEVLNGLPMPLTVHLGAGSDKLIGNSEPDTCYSEATKRNRCIGGGGDDICITGPENSDCVGGRGNDYCRTGAGSDGCFGGPGRDICIMGAGQDGCHGGPGNDRLYGGPGADQLYGQGGVDYCNGGPGVGRSHSCEKGPGG
jgi:Ca2+-binding RTX toxin-like protein